MKTKISNRGDLERENPVSSVDEIDVNGKKFYKTFWRGYYVSKDGIIISFRDSRRGYKGNVDLTRPPKYLKYGQSNRGYYQVIFSNGVDIRKSFLVHRVVAETFLGPIPEGYHVDHIDNNIHNNDISNLQFLTPEENVRKANCGRKSKFRKSVLIIIDNKKYYFSTIFDFVKSKLIDYNVIVRARKNRFVSKTANTTIISFYEDATTIEIELETVIRK